MSSCSTTGCQKCWKKGLLVLIVLGALAAGIAIARAETDSRSSTGKRNDVGLEGYCPVCVIKTKKWVKGDARFQATYDSKTYYFPSDKERQMFLADPAKYVPALGGDCTVCFAKMGKRVRGSVHHAALYGGRLYLFPSDKEKKAFFANAAEFTNVDLALDGRCAVCLAKMKKDVPGKPEFTAIYQGLRYQFPSDKQRKMFLANPAQFVSAPTSNTRAATQNASRAIVTVSGKSTCAGCEHGVTPIGSPDELGLAVNAADGKVYVVEDAHKLYPQVYAKRFEGLPLKVSGTVLKTKGKITWIKPMQLRVLN